MAKLIFLADYRAVLLTFDSVQSSMIKNQKEDRWDRYVTLRVEHPTHAE